MVKSKCANVGKENGKKMGSVFTSSQKIVIKWKKVKIVGKYGQKTKNSLRGRTNK